MLTPAIAPFGGVGGPVGRATIFPPYLPPPPDAESFATYAAMISFALCSMIPRYISMLSSLTPSSPRYSLFSGVSQPILW